MRAFKKGRGVRVRALQITLFALTLFTACIGNAAPADPPRSQQQPEKSREPRPRITVSEKTTRILQPLDAEGYVDYFAALNQMTSQGVTPENNAEVLFVRALGVSDLQPPARARFFKLLKIEPLPERGEYLAEFAQFVKEKTGRHATKKEEADFSSATQEPWAASDLPLVAEWLTSQAKPLDLIVEGTKRPKCYIPLAGSRQAGLLAVPLPAVQATRLPARALAARAMLRLREGKLSEAEKDLLACHRLGRLVGSAPFLIPALIGIAIDATACQGDARLMEQGRLTAESALAYQQELRRLASLPVMADVIDGPERFVFLDQVSIFARDPKNAPHGVPDIFLRDYWDEILKFGNTQFDKAVAAARLPTAPERKQAFAVLDQGLRAMQSEVGDLVDWIFLSFRQSWLSSAMRRQIGKTLIVTLMPAIGSACEAETRARTRDALGQLGLAVTAYRADHSAYPESLNVLAPRYIAQVPRDLFNQQPLHYKRQADGVLLYSVGANGVDEGGRSFDSQPPGDDLVLKISRGAPKKR